MGRLQGNRVGAGGVRHKYWSDFTYLFRSRKINNSPGPEYTTPDPHRVEVRRRLEDYTEQRQLTEGLREVWE
jgi:hypothetical protein